MSWDPALSNFSVRSLERRWSCRACLASRSCGCINWTLFSGPIRKSVEANSPFAILSFHYADYFLYSEMGVCLCTFGNWTVSSRFISCARFTAPVRVGNKCNYRFASLGIHTVGLRFTLFSTQRFVHQWASWEWMLHHVQSMYEAASACIPHSVVESNRERVLRTHKETNPQNLSGGKGK